jgi:hypothetical protein
MTFLNHGGSEARRGLPKAFMRTVLPWCRQDSSMISWGDPLRASAPPWFMMKNSSSLINGD